MNLILVHRILIAAAILLGLIFIGFSTRRYLNDGDTLSLVMAAVTTVATIGLVGYLRWFRRKNRNLPNDVDE